MSESFKTLQGPAAIVTPMLLIIHLVCVGLWLGCVLTEALFERALLAHGHTHALLLAQLHKRVDLFVEIPAFVGVTVTGACLIGQATPALWLYIKIAMALLAVLANIVCVGLVFGRASAAQAGNWARFDQLDKVQHQLGAVVLLGMLGALGFGLALA